jgi:SOS response regulatory protein OraA/RecX
LKVQSIVESFLRTCRFKAENMHNKQPKNTAYDKAVSLLSIRMHTSKELGKKLKLRGYADDEAQLAIQRLTEAGYLDDSKTASAYLDSMISHKTYGFYMLKAKLGQKGLEQNLINQLLEEKLPLEVEVKIADKYVYKNRLDGIKAAAALKRKGFRSQIVSKYFSDSSL